jgi:tetratricopeptide (TPR) repeat protein
MSTSSSGPPPGSDEPASNGRLDSWKEIAAYLRRSVRTAKRWEKEEQLPVRRHLHGKRDSVYAYRAELDDWWSNRRSKLSDENGAEEIASEETAPVLDEPQPLDLPTSVKAPERVPLLPKKSWTAALFSVGLFLALLVVAAFLSNRNSGHASGLQLPFKLRDWVLVTSFENRTGRPIFDGTLEAALERELRNSRYVNVVPRERINDALRLMRKPEEARVDAALGREICLRDGHIRALVTGRIENFNSKFLLSANLLDPMRGTTVASVAEEAVGEGKALAAIRRASDRLRKALGEALPEIGAEEGRLAKVTTRSLRALQLYTQAEPLGMTKPRAAQELLRQAVAEDPEFAAGHMALAEAIFSEMAPSTGAAAAALPEAESAFRLSQFATDWERYGIRGAYYDLTGNTEKAAAAYEALLALHPDDVGALNDLVPIYGRLGRKAESVRCALRRADLTPNDFRNQILALGRARSIGTDPDPYWRRARALISDDVLDRVPQQAVYVEMFPVIRLWSGGNIAKAASEMERIWKEIEPAPLGRRDKGLQSIASYFLAMGKLRIAGEVYDRISDPQTRLRGLAMVSYYRGDERRLVEQLKAAVAHPEEIPLWGVSGVPPADPVLGVLLVRAGMLSEADRIVAREKNRESIPGFLESVQGELALARGQRSEAIRLLKICCDPGVDGPGPYWFHGRESLASALDAEGKSEEAIRVLELACRGSTAWGMSNWNLDGPVAYAIRAQLAKVYRRVGREADARKLEEELSRLLSQADADEVTLVALKKSRARETIASGKSSSH